MSEKGGRELWELHATYFYKGLSVLGAWDSGFNDFSLTSPNAKPVHLPVGGYNIQVGYILTGEKLQTRSCRAAPSLRLAAREVRAGCH